MTTTPRTVVPDPIVVRRQNELFDLYNQWSGDGEPDDDPDFVVAAREVMGLPPLVESADDLVSIEDIEAPFVMPQLGALL